MAGIEVVNKEEEGFTCKFLAPHGSSGHTVCTPPPTHTHTFCWEEVKPPTNFSKRGGLETTLIFRGELLAKGGVTLLRQGRLQFLHKNLKHLVTKKVINKNVFLCRN